MTKVIRYGAYESIKTLGCHIIQYKDGNGHKKGRLVLGVLHDQFNFQNCLFNNQNLGT